MKTKITARHFELTEGIEEHINQKLAQHNSHFKDVREVSFILDIDSKQSLAEVNVNVRGEIIHSKVESDNMYKSIDLLIHKLVSLLDKKHEKQVS
jgi:putative sigma-54 modulation protein